MGFESEDVHAPEEKDYSFDSKNKALAFAGAWVDDEPIVEYGIQTLPDDDSGDILPNLSSLIVYLTECQRKYGDVLVRNTYFDDADRDVRKSRFEFIDTSDRIILYL